MLFGEPPYERYGAPEPGLLFDLVPVLPDGVLAEAVWGVAGIGVIWPTERLRLLAALLGRSAGAGRAFLLAQAVIQNHEVIPYLARAFLPRALDAVRAFEWWDEPGKATALALLAARVSKPSLEDVLAAAHVPIDYGDQRRAPALAEAISRLDRPLAESAFSELLKAIRALQEGNARGIALVGLLEHVAESAKGSIVFEALAAFRVDEKRTPERAGALAALSWQLSEPLKTQVFEQAMDAARDLPSDGDRALALVAIVEALSLTVPPKGDGTGREGKALDAPKADPVALKTVLDELHDLPAEDIALFPLDLARLAPHLSEAQLASALQGLPDEPELLRGAMADLAPHLPKGLLGKALRLGDEESLCLAVLQALAPHLPPPLLGEALDLALSLEGRWARGRALAAVWPHLDAALRQRASGVTGDLLSGETIRELWYALSQEQQIELAEEAIHATCSYYGGAEAALSPEPKPVVPPAPP
jgi:hypothetical protein